MSIFIYSDISGFKSISKNEVKNVQERCANIIFEHIEASVDNDMN